MTYFVDTLWMLLILNFFQLPVCLYCILVHSVSHFDWYKVHKKINKCAVLRLLDRLENVGSNTMIVSNLISYENTVWLEMIIGKIA